MALEPESNVTRDVVSSMEAPLPSGKCYRHAPERALLRVRVLALRRYKPPSVPETWCDSLPVTSDLEVAPPPPLDWLIVLVCMLISGPVMLGVVFLVGYGLICLASAGPLAFFQFFLFPVSVVVVATAAIRAKYSFLEVGCTGICLLGSSAASACFIPYASIRNVQTYLDEGVRGTTSRGVILGVDGEQTVTLELGGNTARVVSTICHHTHVVVLHSRCNWS